MAANNEIQRIGSTARTGRFLLGKREGLDPVLGQGWSSTPDSCRFSWREGSADRDVPGNFESGRTETNVKR
jgi:hypothetical protein